MIETVWTFCRRGVKPNLYRILATTHPYLSGIIALSLDRNWLGLTKPVKISDVTGLFVTYDTVVFGFTATAIALAIAIPSTKFIEFLSSIRDGSTPFRDFLFILAWNGFVHIWAFILLMPPIILGNDWTAGAPNEWYTRVYIVMMLWVQMYAVFQFLVTTIGVFELGDLYAKYVSKNRPQ